MKTPHKGPKTAQQRPTSTPPYEVGYGKPPTSSQFKPGESGNSGGRPVGSKNKSTMDKYLGAAILEEASRSIKIRDGERVKRATVCEAVARSISLNALKGGYWHQRLFTDLVRNAEREKQQADSEWAEGLMDYKIRAQSEVDRRTRLGLDCSDIIPHPDQIILDLRNNEYFIIGPLDKAERDACVAKYEETWASTFDTLEFGRERNDELRRELEYVRNPRQRKRLQGMIDRQKEVTLQFNARREDLLKELRPFGYVETRPSWEWLE